MAQIIFNKKLPGDFYLMKVSHANNAVMGQFYMLRSWSYYPVLSRPISIFDADENSLTFLYKVFGEGTAFLAGLKEGESITLEGPYGNGWPKVKGRIALVGGGVGIAPLYLAAKELKKFNSQSTVDIYLGFAQEAVLSNEFEEVSDNLIIKVGGKIPDYVNLDKYDYVLSCGPDIMMRALYKKNKKNDTPTILYVSLETRMACGFGACLVCSCKTKSGNKKTCTDGPVFLASEVFDCE